LFVFSCGLIAIFPGQIPLIFPSVKSALLEPELQLLESQRRARGRVHLETQPEVRPAVYAKNPQKMLISGTKIGTYPRVMSK
jgi:hypothetical protein